MSHNTFINFSFGDDSGNGYDVMMAIAVVMAMAMSLVMGMALVAQLLSHHSSVGSSGQ